MSSPVVLPSPAMIEGWKDLNEMPIVETAPRSVPMTTIISSSVEGMMDRVIPSKVDLPSSKFVNQIKELEKRIEIINTYIYDYYSRRSTTSPLTKYIESKKKEMNTTETPAIFRSPQSIEIVKNILNPQIELFKKEIEDTKEIASYLSTIFGDSSFWTEGKYSDSFLNTLCLLIHKFTALEFIVPYKRGLINDISIYLNLINDSALSAEVLPIRMKVVDPHSISKLIISECSNIPYTDVMNIFDIILTFIRESLLKTHYITPESHNSYVTASIFLINYYNFNIEKEKTNLMNTKKPVYKMKPFSVDVKNFIRSICSVHKTLNLFFEISPEITQNLPSGFFQNKEDFEINNSLLFQEDSLEKLIRFIREDYRLFSSFLTTYSNEPPNFEVSSHLYKSLEKTLRVIGRIISLLSEHLELIRVKAPETLPEPAPENIPLYQYEYAMKNIKDSMKSAFLLHLMNCRLSIELIIDNFPFIYQCIVYYTQYIIQSFLNITLPSIILKHKDHLSIKQPLETIRTLLGYYKTPNDYEISEKTIKLLKNKSLNIPISSPSLSLLELVRVQIQQLINNGSLTLKSSGIFSSDYIHPEEAILLKQFIEDTKLFSDLLSLPKTIFSVSDQSSLYFKERWLDVCHTSFFKVTTSLPVILSNFALAHSQKEELTAAIFYPLSIYDDAASTSLKILKSRLIYEEIKEEARICLITITRMISDNSFNPIRKYAALRSLPKSLTEDVLKRDGAPTRAVLTETFAVSHIGSLLSQNQLFLFGCPIDTKTLMADRINEIIHDSIMELINLTGKHGILVIIIIRKLLQILESLHSIMESYGLPLMKYSEIFRNAIRADSPNSLTTLLLYNISNHLIGPLLNDYYLMTIPNRLVPKIHPMITIPGVTRDQVSILLETILRPTATFVSTESFRELFWLLEDGSIFLLHQQLLIELEDLFTQFCDLYINISKQLTRIKDASLNANSSQVFDRFLGAYRFFLDNSDVHALFQLMAEIGSVIAVSEMMDHAYLLKKTTKEQVGSFILSRPLQEVTNSISPSDHPELFELFDNNFRDSQHYFDSFNQITTNKEIVSPFLYQSVLIFSRLLQDKYNLFEETTTDLLDLQSLKGFASNWSVLEFLFCMLEVTSNEKSPGSLVKYGEGVQLCSALILSLTNQQNLFRLLNIGEKINAHDASDFSANTSKSVKKFQAVYKLVSSSLSCAISTIQPAVQQVFQTK